MPRRPRKVASRPPARPLPTRTNFGTIKNELIRNCESREIQDRREGPLGNRARCTTSGPFEMESELALLDLQRRRDRTELRSHFRPAGRVIRPPNAPMASSLLK